jgi:hypothetical protein
MEKVTGIGGLFFREPKTQRRSLAGIKNTSGYANAVELHCYQRANPNHLCKVLSGVILWRASVRCRDQPT